MKLRNRILATFFALCIAAGAVIPASASHHAANLYDGSCFGTGGSTFAPGLGLSYTNGCSDHQRYLSTYWQYSGGYVNANYGWKDPPGDWNQFDPLGGGATYIYSSHALCTNNYGTCNGYVNTYAP